MLMMGAKREERYNEIGLPLLGYSAYCTGRSCEAYIKMHRVKIGTYIKWGSFVISKNNACAWHKISFKNAIIKQMSQDLKGIGCLL